MTILKNNVVKILLLPFSLIYGVIIYIRNKFYDWRIFNIKQISGIRCISVGNITTGGTGKTPAVEYLANLFIENEKQVSILSRGYRRKSKGTVIVSNGHQIMVDYDESGDEPQLLARNLAGVPVVVESDRFKGGMFIRDTFNPDIIILDDGFQHRRINRDLDILLIDCSAGLENDILLPAGTLRESLAGLKRSDIILLTRVDQVDQIASTRNIIKKHTNVPIFETIHQAVSLNELNGTSEYSVELIKNKKVAIFSGIGNPDAFRNTIMKLGADIASENTFSDHHNYSRTDLQQIQKRAVNSKAQWIITTEKDAVRLSNIQGIDCSISYLKIKLKILKNEPALLKLLNMS